MSAQPIFLSETQSSYDDEFEDTLNSRHAPDRFTLLDELLEAEEERVSSHSVFEQSKYRTSLLGRRVDFEAPEILTQDILDSDFSSFGPLLEKACVIAAKESDRPVGLRSETHKASSPLERKIAVADAEPRSVAVVVLNDVGRSLITVANCLLVIAIILVTAEIAARHLFISGYVVLALVFGSAGLYLTAMRARAEFVRSIAKEAKT
jgi:hypothetical protein